MNMFWMGVLAGVSLYWIILTIFGIFRGFDTDWEFVFFLIISGPPAWLIALVSLFIRKIISARKKKKRQRMSASAQSTESKK